MDLMMPVLYPGTVQELLELGLLGIAMSRYTGSWVGIKAVSDTLDAVSTVAVKPYEPAIVLPNDFHFATVCISVSRIRGPSKNRVSGASRFQRRKLSGAQTGSIA